MPFRLPQAGSHRRWISVGRAVEEAATGPTVGRATASESLLGEDNVARTEEAKVSDTTDCSSGVRPKFFSLTVWVLGGYLAVGVVLSLVYVDREVLREEFRFAGNDMVRPAVTEEMQVLDASRQHEIDRYLDWAKRPKVDATAGHSVASGPAFAPRCRLGKSQKLFAILNPLAVTPLEATVADWNWANLMASRGRLDLLETGSGRRWTLTGSNLERLLGEQQEDGRGGDDGMTLQLGDYRPGPRVVSVTATDSFAAEGDFVSRRFELTSERPVAVSVEAGLDNAWLSIEGRLHNETTFQQQRVSLMLREFHGVADTRGSDETFETRHVGYLAAVPPGTYTLHVHAERSSASPGEMVVKVSEGGSYHWPGLWWLMAIVGGLGVGLGLFSSTRSMVPQI